MKVKKGKSAAYSLNYFTFFSENNQDVRKCDGVSMEHIRIRISEIRRWLRNQLIAYQEKCDFVKTINSNYIPTTLEETKKVCLKHFSL